MINLNDPAVNWIIIPVLALLVPIVAILLSPIQIWMKQRSAAEARRMYERLTREKLDILRSAVAMGYKGEDLADLDARLERLVGPETLAAVLPDKRPPGVRVTVTQDPKLPTQELDLESEMERIRQANRIAN